VADEGVMARLDAFCDKNSSRRYGSADELIQAFSTQEKRSAITHGLRHFGAQWSWSAALAIGLAALTVWKGLATWVVFGLVAAASMAALYWHFASDDADATFLTPAEVEKRRVQRRLRS